MSTPRKPQLNEMIHLELGHALPYFERNHFTTVAGIADYRTQYHNVGLYRSAYFYNQTESIKDAYLYADFYFDFDNKDDVELAREDLLFVIWKMSLSTTFHLPLEAFRIYFSGMKGFHLVIPKEYIGIQPSQELDKLFRWIALGFQEESINETLDLVVYERRRLFRLENSQHPESGLHKIPLHYQEASKMPIDEIRELAKQPRIFMKEAVPVLIPQARRFYEQEAKEMLDEINRLAERFKNRPPAANFKPGEVPKYIQQILDEGPVDGYRNETAAGLTSYFLQQGLEEAQIWDELVSWNQGSLTDGVLRTTMRSILDGGYTYSRSRLRALADKDLSKTGLVRPKKGESPPWKTT